MTHMVQITHGKGQSSGRNGMEVQCNILEECGTSCTKMVAQGLCIKQACTLAQPGKYGWTIPLWVSLPFLPPGWATQPVPELLLAICYYTYYDYRQGRSREQHPHGNNNISKLDTAVNQRQYETMHGNNAHTSNIHVCTNSMQPRTSQKQYVRTSACHQSATWRPQSECQTRMQTLPTKKS